MSTQVIGFYRTDEALTNIARQKAMEHASLSTQTTTKAKTQAYYGGMRIVGGLPKVGLLHDQETKKKRETMHPSAKKYGTHDTYEIIVIVVGQRLRGRILNVGFELGLGGGVDNGFRRLQGGRLDERKLVVTGKLSRQPQKGLFKVVVGLGGNVVVLQVLFAVERNGFGLYLTILDFHLVTHQDNGNVFTNPGEVCRE